MSSIRIKREYLDPGTHKYVYKVHDLMTDDSYTIESVVRLDEYGLIQQIEVYRSERRWTPRERVVAIESDRQVHH